MQSLIFFVQRRNLMQKSLYSLLIFQSILFVHILLPCKHLPEYISYFQCTMTFRN